jgi:hypothetical protein
MELSENVLIEIINGVNGELLAGSEWLRNGTGAERRKVPRQRASAAIPVTRYGCVGADVRAVELYDLSTRGLGVVVRDSMIAPGEQFVVHARRVAGAERAGSGEGKPVDLLCTARRVRVRSDGRVLVGAEFSAPGESTGVDHVAAVRATVGGSVRLADGPVPPADRRRLWGQPTGRRELSGEAPQRADERARVHAVGWMCHCNADGTESSPRRVEVLDLSAGGACVAVGERLAVGDQFILRVPREDDVPLTRLCTATRVGEEADRHRVGARFVPFSRRVGRSWVARVIDWLI